MVYRYRISNWHQLCQCKSNTSQKLSIRVADIFNSSRLSGTRISIVDEEFGVIFSYVVDPKGDIVGPDENVSAFNLTTDQILQELNTYGFYVEYPVNKTLSGDQLSYLMTLKNLHYDKIRLLAVWHTENGIKEFSTYVVCFNSEKNGEWLNAGYAPSIDEFDKALNNGSAINITYISDTQGYQWDWLYNWVANIDDILKQNIPSSGDTL